MGVIHPNTARIALITRCDSQTTYQQPDLNWFSRQFDPVLETNHSIHSETVIRVAEPDCRARLALRLKAALLASIHILTKHFGYPVATIVGRATLCTASVL